MLAEKILIAGTLCLALYWIFWTSVIWYRYHPHLPWRDLFLVLRQLVDLDQVPTGFAALQQWFEPHYGAHRIALLRLLLWLDVNLLAGQNHMFYGAGWACLLILTAIYTRLAAQQFRQPGDVLFAALLAVIWLFAPAHIWNLLNPINISWHLTLTFSLLAFWVLLRRPVPPRVRDWSLAYLLCSLAALCNFGGVIAWLLLPALACLLHERAIIPTLVLSILLAGLYAGGMSSDAAQATQWDSGSPEVIEQIRAQAQSMLAANTASRISEKTLQFLAWPLTESSPGLAVWLSFFSVAVLAIYAAHGLRSRWVPRSELEPWFVFCLMAAGLCFGIALATQLGRLMQHPNHIHGPSYERYETIVVVYWLSISGLLLGLKQRLGDLGWLLLVALLALALVLQRPAGVYLKQEIQNTEAAAGLYVLGEQAHLAGQAPTAGNRFTPEFVFTFDDFFREHQLAYRVPTPLPDDLADVGECMPEDVKVSSGPDDQAGKLFVDVNIPAPGMWWTRTVILYSDNKLVGRLAPVHDGDFSPPSLLKSRFNNWRGTVAGESVAPDRELILALERPLGAVPWCKFFIPAPV